MTAPAAAIASFVQPAARLAMGDTVGGAVGGFAALMALLSPSMQADAAGAGKVKAETPAETGDLAALLGQTGAVAWMTQAMSQAVPAAEDTAAPVTCDMPQTKAPLADTEQTDTAALDALLRRQAPEAVDPAILESLKPVKGQTAAQSLQSLAPPEAEPAAATAAVVAQVQAAVQSSTEDQTRTVAETVAAPVVVAPPVEARPSAAPRKASAVGDARVQKLQSADATPAPTAMAAAEDTAQAAAGDLAPVEVVAVEAETAEAPARTPDTTLQTLVAKLDSVAAGAANFAAQVRGAPETVAKLAAGIIDKLGGQSTRFDLQLDPHGLGKVDVSVEIGSDGKLTAQMGFDSAVGMTELRGRAQELRTALEQAGFTLAEGALSFDFSGERGGRQTADSDTARTDQAGKAFARALGALDEELAAAPTRYQARRGLDLLI